MKQSMLILGLCLLMMVGATGCDDDDLAGLVDVPIDQQVAAAASGVTTSVTAVSALAVAFFPPPSAAGTEAQGGPSCTDESASVCDGGSGTATLCDAQTNNPFLDLTDCENLLVGGELDGNPNPAASLVFNTGQLTLSMLVDNSVDLDGTLTVFPQTGGGTCFGVSYDLTVTDGNIVSTTTGSLTQCSDGGFPNGSLNVAIPSLNLSINFFFNGTQFAFAEVFQLSNPRVPTAFCDVDLIAETADCSDGTSPKG